MGSLFSGIAHWTLIGLGSILSILPGGAAIGAPLMVAGAAIPTKNSGTQDVVSTYAANLQTGINTAGAMQSAGAPVLTGNYVMAWIQRNMFIVIIGLGILFAIIFKPFKRRRR